MIFAAEMGKSQDVSSRELAFRVLCTCEQGCTITNFKHHRRRFQLLCVTLCRVRLSGPEKVGWALKRNGDGSYHYRMLYIESNDVVISILDWAFLNFCLPAALHNIDR